MRTNLLSKRIQLQTKTVVESALGQTETWLPVDWINGRIVPLSAETIASYQQLGSSVTHKVIVDKDETLNLADYRFVDNGTTYTPTNPPITMGDNKTIVVLES